MKTLKSKSKSLAGRLHRFRSARAAALTSLMLLACGPALALTWDGGGANDNWSTADNWDTNTVPVGGDILVFAGSTDPTPNNDFVVTTSFGGLQFDAGASAFTFSGTTIRLVYNIIFSGNPAAPVTHTFNQGFLIAAGNRQITTQANGNITILGSIGDGGTNRILTKAGSGTLTLSGASNWVGQMRINDGIVNANTIANAGTVSSLGTGTTTPIIRMGNTTTTGTLVYTGAVAAGSTNRQVQVGNNTTVPAGTDTGGASISNNNANTAHTVTFSNATFNAANAGAITARTLTLGGSNTGLNTIGGAIVDNVAVNAVINLTKEGVGTWVLDGTNTYTGTTAVNNGTLLVNGSLGDTAVTVAGAATLGGSGTVGTSSVLNTLTVNGALVPGNSTGILTVNDNLDLNGSLSAELNGTSAGTGHDRVAVNGAVDITGSSLTTSFGTFTPANGNLLFIVLNDGTDAITGTFTGKAQDEIVANYGGFDWKISYNADSTANTFTGTPNGNDIALMAIPEPVSVILSSWKFNPGASTLNGHLASSDTAAGLTVSRLDFHPTFDAVGFVNNEQTTLDAFSTHDRWAADNGLGAIRMRRADYTTAPSGRSATFNSTDTSISSDAGTLGAPIWFSVSTDGLTNATIRKISITNPGASNPTTYYFSKSGDPLGTGVSVSVQENIALAAPITLAASQTVYFSINMNSDGVGTNHNIDQINLLGATVALPPPPPPIGLVTGTLTVGAPHGTYNRLSVTVDPDLLGSSSDTSDLTGTIDLTVNIDPLTGKTSLLTLSAGRVNGTTMNFSAFGYNINATGLSAEVKTLTPPGTVNPDTGVFAANQHGFILDQGTFAGTAAGQPVSETLSPTNTFSGSGTGNGSLTLTPAGTSGPYNLFNAVVILPVAINETIEVATGVNAVITGTGTVKATGQIQMPSSEFNAWMIAQGATSFDPKADTAGNGAPDGVKWALGLGLFDNPLPYLLKPHPTIPGTFTISLPPGGTVSPLTVESSTNLMPPWTTVPAGQMTPAVNPIPIDSTGNIGITPTSVNKLFLRMRANP